MALLQQKLVAVAARHRCRRCMESKGSRRSDILCYGGRRVLLRSTAHAGSCVVVVVCDAIVMFYENGIRRVEVAHVAIVSRMHDLSLERIPNAMMLKLRKLISKMVLAMMLALIP